MSETETLMDHLKNRIDQPGTPSSATTWMEMQSAEREHYENQTRDIVAWRRLDPDEQAQQRLSGSPLAMRVNKINIADLEQYWAGEVDTDLMQEYLNASKKI
jgi:hypothetical protein